MDYVNVYRTKCFDALCMFVEDKRVAKVLLANKEATDEMMLGEFMPYMSSVGVNTFVASIPDDDYERIAGKIEDVVRELHAAMFSYVEKMRRACDGASCRKYVCDS